MKFQERIKEIKDNLPSGLACSDDDVMWLISTLEEAVFILHEYTCGSDEGQKAGMFLDKIGLEREE